MPPMSLDDLMVKLWSPSATAMSLVEDMLPSLGKQAQDHFDQTPANDFPGAPSDIGEIDDRFEGAYEHQKDELGALWKSTGEAIHDRLLDGVRLCEDELGTAIAEASEHPSVLSEVLHEWMWFAQRLMRVGQARYRNAWAGKPSWDEAQWGRQRKQAFWETVIEHVPPGLVPLSGPTEVMDWGLVYHQVRVKAQRYSNAADLERIQPWLDKLNEWGATLDQPGSRWSCSSPRHLAFAQAGFDEPDGRCDQARRLDHEASADNCKAWALATQPDGLAGAWPAWLLKRGIPDHPAAYRDWAAFARTLAAKKVDLASQQQLVSEFVGEAELDQWLLGACPAGGVTPEQAFAHFKRHQLPELTTILAQRQQALQREAAAAALSPEARPRPRVRP